MRNKNYVERNKTDEQKQDGEDIMTEKYDRKKAIEEHSVYKVDKKLKEKGYEYDEEQVYIPYTYKNPNNPDCRDIYLGMGRHATQECRITYWWCKKVEGVFYGIEKFQRDKLPCEETSDFNSALARCGIEANLDSRKDSYKEFAEQLKKDISQANCLDVLKDKDFDFMEGRYFGDEIPTLTEQDLIDLNKCDMRILIKIVFGHDPVKVYKRNHMPDYELMHCLLHNDKNPSASVYKHVYLCEGCNPPVKLDQYTLIKKTFGVTTSSEVIDILKEKNFFVEFLSYYLND